MFNNNYGEAQDELRKIAAKLTGEQVLLPKKMVEALTHPDSEHQEFVKFDKT